MKQNRSADIKVEHQEQKRNNISKLNLNNVGNFLNNSTQNH